MTWQEEVELQADLAAKKALEEVLYLQKESQLVKAKH